MAAIICLLPQGHVLRVRLRGLARVRGRQLHVLGRSSQEEEEGEEAAREGREGEFGFTCGVGGATPNRERISR